MSQLRNKKFYKPNLYKNDRKSSGSIDDPIVFDWKPERMGDMSEFVRKQEKLATIIELKFKYYGHLISNFEHMAMIPPERPTEQELQMDEDPHQLLMEDYKERRKAFNKKVQDYKDNYHQVWAFIWQMTTEEIRSKMREFPNYEEEIMGDKDPAVLWTWIKLIYDGVDGDQVDDNRASQLKLYSTQQNQLANFTKLRQFQNESISDYYKRYLANIQALCATGAMQAVYTAEQVIEQEQAEMKKIIDFLNKLDQHRYYEFTNNLRNRLNLGFDEYPVTLADAYIAVSRFRSSRSPYQGSSYKSEGAVYVTNNNDHDMHGEDIKSYEKVYNKEKAIKKDDAYVTDNYKNNTDRNKYPNNKSYANDTNKAYDNYKKNNNYRNEGQDTKCFLCNKYGHHYKECENYDPNYYAKGNKYKNAIDVTEHKAITAAVDRAKQNKSYNIKQMKAKNERANVCIVVHEKNARINNGVKMNEGTETPSVCTHDTTMNETY
jgi:hypothetical protein